MGAVIAPQEMVTIPTATMAPKARIRKRRRHGRLPTKPNPATPKGSSHAAVMGMAFPRSDKFSLVSFAGEIVSFEATEFAPGVTLAGENEQVNVFGKPVQDSPIAVLKAPACGFTITVNLPDFPARIVIDPGVALRENVDVGAVTGVGGMGGG